MSKKTFEELWKYKKVKAWPTLDRDREILKVARQMIESVPYKVTLRWLFYRLLQQGFYTGKTKGYNQLNGLMIQARRRRYDGYWHLGSFIDEVRTPIPTVCGCRSEREELEELVEKGFLLNIQLDHFYKQKFYVECWFEARAMIGQFRQYAKGVTLVPCGGLGSFSLFWESAGRINGMVDKYDKDPVILYFGDLDRWGHIIYESARKDMEELVYRPLEFLHVGLTEEQVEKYGIPENPEKPGYQWEALDDHAAREIIEGAMEEYVDSAIVEAERARSDKRSAYWGKRLTKALASMLATKRGKKR
jgi:hypothetical protein